ncbi:MAG: carboxylesterase family protein, partial [Caulobacteraceae bacterium]
MDREAGVHRRAVIGGATAAAGLTTSTLAGAAGLDAGPRLGPIVETADGKVRGYVAGGIHTFRGLRYGATTGGANRFKPPVRPAPWTGVMETLIAGGGSIAPQVLPKGPNYEETRPDSPPMSEDCLFLNLFTPGVDGAKRPVMVYLHGGAWSTGSGVADLFDGTRLSRRGDTVIVSINHRLNLFGYLYLA